ncbi:MFS transporter [Amycolatopsis endophytica]|uniref:Putative proline/betaine transporter n=1 Tax=Amycolatopsis endophytica TaxID=860233 RepID=A0A853B9Y4_9PSEU|nr:MFS transporter [Amycolatopsis endophytica]NYI91584.1 MHS family proline/betaine transporter-like MFS transporter [Amycolatopsis endophytica]
MSGPDLSRLDHEPVREAPARARRRAVAAATLGNVIEWYDFAIYGLFAKVLAANFFPAADPAAGLLATFAVFAVSFGVRPLGAFVFGYYGDRYGRSRALAATVVLMGVGTTLIGVLPTYHSLGLAATVLLVLCRVLQGLSAGGEWSGSSTFLVEYAPRGRRGFFGSFVQFGSSAGSLIGSLVGALIGALASEEALYDGLWRIPFILGGLIGAFGLFLRWKLEDTPEFRKLAESGAVAAAPVRGAFADQWRQGLKAIGFTMAYTVCVYITLTYMPTFVSSTTHIDLTGALFLNAVQIAVMMTLLPVFGLLSDRVGRRPVLLVFCALCVLVPVPLFLLLSQGTVGTVIAAQCLLAVMVAMIGGAGPAATAELFPTGTRYTSFGISYNIAVAAFGGTAPFISTFLIDASGSSISPAFYMVLAGLVSGLTVLFAMRETAHRPL